MRPWSIKFIKCENIGDVEDFEDEDNGKVEELETWSRNCQVWLLTKCWSLWDRSVAPLAASEGNILYGQKVSAFDSQMQNNNENWLQKY